MSSNVKVGIKFRPLIEQEHENLSIQWIVKGNSIVSLDEETNKLENNDFHFDYVFNTNSTNSDVFDGIIKPVVDAVIEGFNGTIFCYGQFNSGKTYTMTGTLEDPGIIPLIIKYIFNIISNTIKREFLLRVSYLEICDEKINDLLNKNQIDLKLYKDDNGQIIVNCKEEISNSSDNMLSIMTKGIKNKKIQQTNRNNNIGSHSVFRIMIESQEIEGDSNNVQVSQLNLVDLAGFKKRDYTDVIEEHQIDKSLLGLESLILQLNKSQDVQEYISNQNSKLTELLQLSLSGNAFIAIICTVIPVALEETYWTLSFASQVKNIKIKPHRNEIMSDAPLLIRYAKQLNKLQIELERIQDGNSSIEIEEVESNKLQQKYQINCLLEERIKLLKTQIISGCTKNYEESFKRNSRRKQIWFSPGAFKQYLSVFHTKTGLPTIKEISSEKPYKKNIMQSVDVLNRTFQTAFTDFELELIDCTTDYEAKESDDIENEHIKSTENMCNMQCKSNNSFLTPEKQDSSVQTSSNQASPSTPKSTLRKYILDLTKDLIELREFTTLEKQLLCEENHCCTHDLENQIAKQSTCSNFKNDKNDDYSSNLMIQLEEEKIRLTEDLELKIQELDEIKNDIQSLKLDIEKLQKTIYLLTNENMEMSNKLSVEKERSKQAEFNLQKTIDELYIRISKITDEKISLESDIMVLNEHLESLRSKTTEKYNDEQLIAEYQNKIDALKTENIELSAVIAEKNRELENIKESKSLLYDHECIYKDKVTLLTEKNECLIIENNELSTDLIDKIEENDMLKEQCNILESKISLMKTTNSDENDIEQLRTENNILKAEIMELKMKITTVMDENVKFSHNLLETMEDHSNSSNEKLSDSTLHLSTIIDNPTQINEIDCKKILQEKSNEELVNKVIMLQDEVNYLSRLNKKLSDLKLSSCSQCTHLKNLNDSRRATKLEAKMLNLKLEDLQKKFDRKCADIEVLKLKVNQELNLSFTDASLNTSFVDGMNVSFIEEKVYHLNNELHALKDDRDKLSILYKEKCDEFEKLHDEVVDAKNIEDNHKPKKYAFKNETRIEQIQKSIDQVKEDIDELKKNNTNFTSILSKFKIEKASLLGEINTLKSINGELQQKVLDKEILSATATEKAQILENELSNMSKEIEQFSAKEKMMQTEKLILEVELEDLKAEKESKNVLITGLNRTIDELNECISSLKNELDLITNQKNELTISTEMVEHKYKNELQLLTEQYVNLEREKQKSVGAEKCATLRAKELESDIEKLKADLTKQENLYQELEKKVSRLENLLQESESEKEIFKEKLQTLEIQLINSEDDLMFKYKNEFETITRKFEEYTKESEIKLSKINETLDKYVEENYNLTQELTKLRDIELKLKILQNEDIYGEEKTLITTNKKLQEELGTVKECMIKELKSFKCKVNSVDFLNKTANEIFILFLQTIMLKEEEIIKEVKELFERDKQKLEDGRRQSADAEKRVMIWAKELETEIEKLQTDLTKKECLCMEQQNKVYQLEHLLRESNYEKETLKEKMEALETDFNNLQSEFDKQCKIDIPQKEEAIIVAQKREKEIQEALKSKEIELQFKIKSEKNLYEKKIEDLICTIEIYKTKNMELKNNIEGFEANEKQLKNIIEVNCSELKMNKQTIHKMTIDLEQLTEAYNKVTYEVEQKTSKIENITVLLKKKCDMLSEYKTKLETIMPDYEMLQNQVKDRKESIERYKEEITKLKMERENQIDTIKDKLNTEEIKCVGLNKQLNELNNKNIALIEDLDNLKEKYEELQQTNIKLERKIRNSTSKVKVEEEMEELRDVNKRLQHNLEGASNRITELQENKNKMFKELVNLKGQYELLSQENVEIKKTLLLYRSKQSISQLSQEDSKYDALIQEKNKIALELEGKKLLLTQKDKEIKENVHQIKDLTATIKELDKRLKEYTAIIHERNAEILNLKDKLSVHQAENKLINGLEEKLETLEAENKKLKDQLKTFKTKLWINIREVEDSKLHNDKVLHTLGKESAELQMKLNDYENRLELKSNSSSSRSTSPAFENSRRRRSRNEMFNQRRQLENIEIDTDINANEEACQLLRNKIQELELQLVLKNGQIAALETQIQSENFPYQQKCKELEELLLTYRRKNTELGSEIRKLQRTLNDVNSWECDTCRRWRVNRKDQGCQTQLFSTNNGIIKDHEKLTKLEKEKTVIRNICRSQYRQIKHLQDKIRELDVQAKLSSKCTEFFKEKSNQQYTLAMNFNKQFDLEKNLKLAMKENVPAYALKLIKPSNYGGNTWNNY